MSTPVDATRSLIHESAIIHPEARLAASVEVGAATIIGPGVEIGAGVKIGAHALIERDTKIGAGCRIFHGAVVGSDPQDLKYAGESTRLEIGERTTVREYCTLNRGTVASGVTRVGSDCLLMTGVHIGHDCVVGDHVILANVAMLGGHAQVGDWAILGGLVGVHQFTRIGAHAFVGGASKIVQDVPPFVLADGNPCRPKGINAIGLQRRGFSKDSISALRVAFRALFKSRERNLGQAIDELQTRGGLEPEVLALIGFIRDSRRGIIT